MSLLALFLGPLDLGFPELMVIVAAIFWIWVLVDCATKEPRTGNSKVVWILIIVLTHFIGALIYLIFRRPQRQAAFGR